MRNNKVYASDFSEFSRYEAVLLSFVRFVIVRYFSLSVIIMYYAGDILWFLSAVIAVYYFRSNLSNYRALFASQIPDNPTHDKFVNPFNHAIRCEIYNMLSSWTFLCALAAKKVKSFLLTPLFRFLHLRLPLPFKTAQQLSEWPTTDYMLLNSVTHEVVLSLLLAMCFHCQLQFSTLCYVYVMQITIYYIFCWLLYTTLEASWVVTSLYLIFRYQSNPHTINLWFLHPI